MMKMYEEAEMQLTTQTFQKWANGLPEKVIDKEEF